MDFTNFSFSFRPIAIASAVLAMSGGVCAQQKPNPPPADSQILQRLGALEKQVTELTSLVRSLLPPPPVADIEPVHLTIANAPAKGSPAAKFVLIEYSDFECPFCGQHAKTVYSQLQNKFIETGRVKYIFRHLPLEQIHPYATKAAEAAECAREQGKFWEFHDRLFANQKALSPADLSNYARAEGLNVAAFQSCVLDGRTNARVRDDLAEAGRLGLTGTPAFLFGEVQSDATVRITLKMTGAHPLQIFETALDKLMGKPNNK